MDHARALKFVAKMLAGRKHVLEVGCADAFGTRIVQQTVGKVTAVDFDPVFVADVRERINPNWPLQVSSTTCWLAQYVSVSMQPTRSTCWNIYPRPTRTDSSGTS